MHLAGMSHRSCDGVSSACLFVGATEAHEQHCVDIPGPLKAFADFHRSPCIYDIQG